MLFIYDQYITYHMTTTVYLSTWKQTIFVSDCFGTQDSTVPTKGNVLKQVEFWVCSRCIVISSASFLILEFYIH